VTIHEAGGYPRHRVCGEFISGVEDEVLEYLTIARHLSDGRRLEDARWFDAAGGLGSMRVPAIGLSRWTLDQRLAGDFLEAGGELRTGSRIQPGAGIVWASGRKRRRTKWVGLKAHVRGFCMDGDLEMHAGACGYAGVSRIEGGQVNVCGLFRAEGLRGGRGSAMLVSTLARSGLGRLAERLAGADVDPGSFCAVAGFGPGVNASGDFAIGDAAQMIPPFTGNGMSMAFESAAIAVEPLVEFAAGRMTWTDARRQTDARQKRRFRRRMTVACGAHGLLTTRIGVMAWGVLARRRMVPYEKLLPLFR
jgi:hypothetical protein